MSIRVGLILSHGLLAALALLALFVDMSIALKVVCLGGIALGLALAFFTATVLFGGLGRLSRALRSDAAEEISDTLPAELAELRESMLALRQDIVHARQNAAEEKKSHDPCEGEMRVELEASRARQAEHEQMLASMHKISDKAREVTSSLSGDVRRLSQLVASVDNGVEIQLFRLRDTHAAMDSMVSHVEEVARGAATASEGAQTSREKALVGAQEVRDAVNAIVTVKEMVLELKVAMDVLSVKAGNIGKVMGVINEVADQTNLLALNAAIEAARAGDAGRGFAVVADEVRKLAEKTMTATREVEDAVKSIQEETCRNVLAVEEAAKYTVVGAERASQAGVFMGDIVERMQDTASQLQNIAEATAQQSHSSRASNEALADIHGAATSTAKHMQTFTSALVRFSSSMDEMDIIVHALGTGDLESAASNQLIQWTSSLELGIPLVDAQHRTLCSYINALHRAMQQHQSKQVLQELLVNLRDYTVTHFSTEEQYFGHSNYPDTEAHKKVHHNFVEKIKNFEQQVQKGSAMLSIELLDFLKDWLIKHIQGTDRQYVSFVQESMRKHGMQ